MALDRVQRALFVAYSETGGGGAERMTARLKLYWAVSKLRKVLSAAELSPIESLYETVFLLGLLRFRVRDRALFEVCRQELAALSGSLSGVLQQACDTGFELALAEFDEVKAALQAMYDSVLYITAREPQIFEFLLMHLELFRRALLAVRKEVVLARC